MLFIEKNWLWFDKVDKIDESLDTDEIGAD
jgi:hypothetical protein